MKLKTFECHAQLNPTRTIDTDDKLFVEGWASTKNIDRYVEVITPEAFASTVESFKANPVLLFQHKHDRPIGAVTELSIDKKAGLWVKAFISKANGVSDIATLIQEGVLRAFSIGFREKSAGKVDEIYTITDLELYEISVVSIPANRESLFSIAKAFEHGTDLVTPMSARNIEERAADEEPSDDIENPPDKNVPSSPGDGVTDRELELKAELERVEEKHAREKVERGLDKIARAASNLFKAKDKASG